MVAGNTKNIGTEYDSDILIVEYSHLCSTEFDLAGAHPVSPNVDGFGPNPTQHSTVLIFLGYTVVNISIVFRNIKTRDSLYFAAILY